MTNARYSLCRPDKRPSVGITDLKKNKARDYTIYHIRVVTDAVAGSSDEAHRYALKAIQYLQRDALITVDDIENEY